MSSSRRLPALLVPAALLVTAVAPAAQASGIVIDFSGTQYDDNFTETANAGLLNASNGVLTISNSSSAAGVALYNDAFPSVSVDQFTVSADVSFGTMATNSLNGNSIGFVTNLSSLEGGNGFVTVFRVRTQSGVSYADMRVFTITSEGALGGSAIATATLGASDLATAFASGTFYKFQVEVNLGTPGTIEFNGSILNSAGDSIIGTFSTLSAAYAGSDQPTYVGLRLGTQGQTITTVDNFTLTAAIPEPSAFAALAGLATFGLAATRRRRAA
jgi:PEP-CTERM putative exosortase interaction domain